MAGVSYGGISLALRRGHPHLAAITLLSVIDNTATTLYPGGLLTPASPSSGPRTAWTTQTATPTDGQGWAYKRIQEGDQICKANQTLHTAAADLIAKIHKNRGSG